MHLIFVCYNCGQFLLAKTGQKTKQCPYCDTRLVLEKTKKVASAENARQASNLIQTLKRKKSNSKT